MNERDLVRFRHMLDAARVAHNAVRGETRSSLDTNDLLRLGLQKTIEIIGEAASKITQETRDQYPQISWRKMIVMRNILIHAYFDVDPDEIWKAVTEDIPPPIAQLEAIPPPVNRSHHPFTDCLLTPFGTRVIIIGEPFAWIRRVYD